MPRRSCFCCRDRGLQHDGGDGNGVCVLGRGVGGVGVGVHRLAGSRLLVVKDGAAGWVAGVASRQGWHRAMWT